MALKPHLLVFAAALAVACSDAAPPDVEVARLVADTTWSDPAVAGGDRTDLLLDLQAPSIVQIRVWSLGPLAGVDAALSAPGAAQGTVAWSGVSAGGELVIDAFAVPVAGRWTLHVRWLQGQGAASYRYTVLHQGGSPFDQPEPFDVDLTEAEQKTPRVGHSATLLADGKVLISGGGSAIDGNGGRSRTSTPASGARRAAAGAAVNPQRVTAVLSSSLLVDPVQRAVSPAAALAQPRAYHTATTITDGKADYAGRIFVTGGLDETGDALLTTELYSPVEGTFTTGPVMPGPRAFQSAIYVDGTGHFLDKKVLLVGGERSRGGAQHDKDQGLYTEVDAAPEDIWYFDPFSGTYNDQVASFEKGRGRLLPALALLPSPDGRLLILGGATNELPSAAGCSENPDSICRCTSDALHLCTDWRCNGEECAFTNFTFKAIATDEVLVYDTTFGKLSKLSARMRRARVGHTATVLHGGRVLIAGGATSMRRRFVQGEAYLAEFPESIDAVEMFEPDTNEFRVLAPLAFPREQHAAVRLAGGLVALVGGLHGIPGGVAPVDAVELYTPLSGRFEVVTLLHEARAGASAVGLGGTGDTDRTSLFVSGGVGASGTLVTGELLELRSAATPASE